jgi:hypothetical protein
MPKMTAEEALEAAKNLDFYQVWAALMKLEENLDRTDKQLAEQRAEAEKQRAEERAEAKRQRDEAEKQRAQRAEIEKQRAIDEKHFREEFDAAIKRIDKVTANVGGLNRSLGELIESLMAGRLWEKFPEYGLVRAYQRVLIYDENNHTRTDIDILLSNGEWAMIVEVKREADDIRDVEHHLNRMNLVRKYPPAEVVGKKLLGAIASAVVSPDVRDLAHKNGLFVLELNGEQVSRVESPEGFEPSVW